MYIHLYTYKHVMKCELLGIGYILTYTEWSFQFSLHISIFIWIFCLLCIRFWFMWDSKMLNEMQKLDSLSERIVSLAFDVISHVLETGPVSSSMIHVLIGLMFWFLLVKYYCSNQICLAESYFCIALNQRRAFKFLSSSAVIILKIFNWFCWLHLLLLHLRSINCKLLSSSSLL